MAKWQGKDHAWPGEEGRAKARRDIVKSRIRQFMPPGADRGTTFHPKSFTVPNAEESCCPPVKK
jgi:hypothetical protein